MSSLPLRRARLGAAVLGTLEGGRWTYRTPVLR
jgi:hypothetical protein